MGSSYDAPTLESSVGGCGQSSGWVLPCNFDEVIERRKQCCDEPILTQLVTVLVASFEDTTTTVAAGGKQACAIRRESQRLHSSPPDGFDRRPACCVLETGRSFYVQR